MTYTKSQIREMVEEVLDDELEYLADKPISVAIVTKTVEVTILRKRFTDKLNSLED